MILSPLFLSALYLLVEFREEGKRLLNLRLVGASRLYPKGLFPRECRWNSRKRSWDDCPPIPIFGQQRMRWIFL